MKKYSIKTISVFLLLVLCTGLFFNTFAIAKVLPPTNQLINKVNTGLFYDEEAENFKEGGLTLSKCTLRGNNMYVGKGKIAIDKDKWDFYFQELELNENGYYNGEVTFIKEDIKKQGLVYIKNDYSIISGIMYDEPNNTVYFTTGDKSANKGKIEEVISNSKNTINNVDITSSNQDNLPSASDSNIRASLNHNTIYGHFIGKPSLRRGGEIPYQFRLGIREDWERPPEVAKFYFTPLKYSGDGLSCTDVDPKYAKSWFQIALSYVMGPFSLGFAIDKPPNYSIRKNSGTSYVYQRISSKSQAYWNGASGSGDNKKGIATDFYIKMMDGTSGKYYGFDVNGAFDVMDIHTGSLYQIKTGNVRGLVKCQ